MNYETKTVVSPRAGMSQEEALESLQGHPKFRAGTKIASIRKRGDKWVAKLSVPKVAGEEEDTIPGLGGEEGPPKPPGVDEEDGPPDEEEIKPKSAEDSKPEGKEDDKEDTLLAGILDALNEIKKGLQHSGDLEPDVEDSPLGKPEAPAPPEGGVPHPPHAEGAPPAPAPPHGGGPHLPPGVNPAFSSFVAETKDNITNAEAKHSLEAAFDGFKVRRINRRGEVLAAVMQAITE